MPSTYTSKYTTGAAVDAALDKAESAIQPGADLADFTSGAATSGQVPTADGSAGVAWADPATTPAIKIYTANAFGGF